jgi:ferredoxin
VPRVADPHLVVDWQACRAHGVCHEVLPELIELDEWGYPLLRSDEVPGEHRRNARRAVRACPTLALRLAD